MNTVLQDIMGPDGAVARRLGQKYEFRPQQMEMASAVEQAINAGEHLLVEAGTGVGKSFAYLLPAIDFAVRTRKRIIISTHTISLQEQLIEKDIPLLQSVYPDEFSAVLVKGRGNYLCLRRLHQAMGRMNSLFEYDRQRDSLSAVVEWANKTTDGSLADLPVLPEGDVWDKVCAENGNCLGKKCDFYSRCFWQAAKRRMQGGRILIVNHALFFSDLALRMAGINYLPKYDAVILDEAHTVEDVAGEHFGLRFGEGGLRYMLRTLHDPRRGKGLLSTHGSAAMDAIQDVEELHILADQFFARCIHFQQSFGRSNGRIQQKDWIENDLSPKLRNLSLHLKAMLPALHTEEESTEITAQAEKVGLMAMTLDTLVSQGLEGCVYWMETHGKPIPRVTLCGAPISVGEGLKLHLFSKTQSVVMCSATLSTGSASRGMGGPPMQSRPEPQVTPQDDGAVIRRQGAHLPQWTRKGAIYAITYRLADSLPQEVLDSLKSEREQLIQAAKDAKRTLTEDELDRLKHLHSGAVEKYLDAGHGECWLKQSGVAAEVAESLNYFDGERYHLLAWSIMPNHVHAVIQPINNCDLPRILHTWKSRTAHAANKILNRSGAFWQVEYYDHLIRDEEELAHAVKYAFNNPANAGLSNLKWRGKNEAKLEPLLAWRKVPVEEHGRAARATGDEEHGRAAHATASKSRGTGGSPVRSQNEAAFAYIKSRLGIDKCNTLLLGSPFDYEKQATLYIETGLPEPSDPLFLGRACEKIIQYLLQTNGGAFVLFTSYSMLKEVVQRLRPQLEQVGLPVLVQGEGPPPRVLLERFRVTPNAVLFGTSSFWQGIDVQGDQLRNVIIVKLPFAVPDEPVIEARLDAIKRGGGNPFMEYSVPEAIIRLKQGFGRLIRSKSDKGIVVILDSRVVTKRYGRLFVDALPGCRRVEVK